MSNDKPYSQRLVCSDKIKSFINNQCKEKFKERHNGHEGRSITENQVLSDMIKKYLGLFTLEDD